MTDAPVTQPPASSDPVAAAEKPNPIARMIEVLTDPVGTMRSIAAKPDFLVAMVVITLLSIATIWLIMPKIDFAPEMRMQLEKAGLPSAQIESQLAVMEKVQKFLMPVMAGFTPLWLAAVAGLLLLAFKMMGGEGTYHQAISVTTYAWIPFLIQGLIMAGLLLAGEPVWPSRLPAVVPSNLGFLVQPSENLALFTLLSLLDLFTFWVLALLGIGFSFVSRLSRAKSIGIVVVLWAITVLIRTGLATLQS